MTKNEALKLALEALEIRCGTNAEERGPYGAITAIKQALEQEKALQALHNENERLGLYKDAYGQPEPEPVVRIVGRAPDEPVLGWSQHWSDFPVGTEFYTSPPHRKPLSDEEIDAIYAGVRAVHHEIDSYIFARAIETAHGIKD